MNKQEMAFISTMKREVKINIYINKTVTAYLPDNLPYRENCPIYITSRSSYTGTGKIYWVNGYRDEPYSNIWPMLKQNEKDRIPKVCD